MGGQVVIVEKERERERGREKKEERRKKKERKINKEKINNEYKKLLNQFISSRFNTIYSP
ncbi:MAG: hypothetical protein M5F18_11115 [Asgard group archaeon]|nr:hypothetical protein [Asgard group archaeon]